MWCKLGVILFILQTLCSCAGSTSTLGVGWFALVHGEHRLQLTEHHTSLLNTGALEFNVLYIGGHLKSGNTPSHTKNGIHRFKTEKDLHQLNSAKLSTFKIYEFVKGEQADFLHMLHGETNGLSSHVISFEKNGIVSIKEEMRMRSKQHNKAPTSAQNTPSSWINTRWRARVDELSASGTRCRFALGSGHIGYQTGSFSWGIDLLDTRDTSQDLVYCPVNDLTGSVVNIFILDTGIGTHTTMNTSNIQCGYDYYYDAVSYAGRPACSDGEGHGSHVAGLVASTIYGVAPGATLRIYKILNDQGYGSFSGLAAGLTDIYTQNIHNAVLTMSLGVYGDSSSTVRTLLLNLMADRNIIVTAAAGNDGRDACNNFPSNVPGVVSVGAVDVNIKRADFSNYGQCVTIFAPGKDIISCSRSGSSAVIMSGTSMATPIVAGAMAIFVQGFSVGTLNTHLVNTMVNYATPNEITNLGNGSPNLFLYLGSFVSGGGSSPPPPSTSGATSTSVGMSINSGHVDIITIVMYFNIMLLVFFI